MPKGAHPLAATRLRDRKQRIVEVWERRARERLTAAKQHDRPALIDSLPDVIDRLVRTLASGEADRMRQGEIAAIHGLQRARLSAYTLDQVIEEYDVLGQVITELIDEDGPLDASAHDVIARAILLAVRDAAVEFARARSEATRSELRATGVRLEHMIEAVKDYAIFAVDPNGYITTWNLGCTRMKLYTVEEAVGQHFSMLYPPEGKRRGEPMGHLRAAAIEGRFRGVGIRVRKNGEPFLADASITPIYEEGTLTGFTKVVQDLTERNALIQERDLSRVDTLQLRADAQYRERFVATLTHDLRSPLATARAGADLLRMAPHDRDKVVSIADRIVEALARADRMIGDLLDASRIHAGESLELQFQRCDLRQIAEDICNELATRHGDRFTIEVHGSTTGTWSAEGLRRVLDNFLSNAVKYGDPVMPITLRIRRVDERMLLSVHNFGATIPAEEQLRLFEPFHRAPSASGRQGWGIGLALAKDIIESHGGIVKAESYPIEGTTFTADLPVDASASPVERAETNRGSEG